jgi:hypothetical protein
MDGSIYHSRIKFICCSIWKTFIHVGSNLSVAYIICNANPEVAEGLIQLTNQVQWYTIVPDISTKDQPSYFKLQYPME